jgi:hypothetical protein
MNAGAAVCEMLALSEAELRDQIVRSEAKARIYRELAQAGIHQLHDLRLEHDRLREQHHRLIDEYRALRVQLLKDVAA